MFGIIVAGRVVQTEFTQVSETQIMFTVPDADSVNHIVVFMTGQSPFPEGMGGSVYFGWPNEAGLVWKLLGHISNNKPSAIFKVSKLKLGESGSANPFMQNGPSHIAQIGISVESLEQLLQQTPEASTAVSNAVTFMDFSTKMIENLYNYASSFAITQSQMVPNPSETFVPMSCLQKWFENFKRKLELDPYFWRH